MNSPLAVQPTVHSDGVKKGGSAINGANPLSFDVTMSTIISNAIYGYRLHIKLELQEKCHKLMFHAYFIPEQYCTTKEKAV